MPFYYDKTTKKCLGFWSNPDEGPDNATATETAPISGDQEWIGGKWEWPIATLKAQKIADIRAAYDAMLESGLSYMGKVLQIRPEDTDIIDVIGQEARWASVSGTGWDSAFAWRMADDSMLPLPTPEDMIALATAAKNEVYRLKRVKWFHEDALKGLNTISAVKNYNISSGWQA